MRVLESASPVESLTHLSMALQKYAPSGNAPSVNIKHLSFSSKVPKKAELDEANPNHNMDVDIDLREIYFLIMHFLSAGPCHKTYIQFWNELLEHQLLPRRYHAWYSRTGACSGDKDDDGLSFPLNYNMLVERYSHIEKDHLVKLLKQLLLNTASPSLGMNLGNAPNAADVPTLLGSGSFSLLSYDRDKMKEVKRPPPHMRWPHMKANQVHGLSLREIGGGFPRHHRAPSIRAACYALAKPSTMVQKMQNIKRLRGHRNAVYCAIFDRSGRYVVTGSDDRLVKIWSMETAYCLASCRGHDGDITDLAVSSNNALVASSSNDCVIRVWRLPDGLPISVLRGHTGAVTAIAFSPRLNALYQLLSSSDDGTCRIWDARYTQSSPRLYVPRPSDSVIGKSSGPSSSTVPQSRQIFCCAFNANGTVFVTGSSDNLARVWNACKLSMDDTDQPIHEIDVLSGHENDVNYVQFSGCAVASRFSTAETLKEENIPKFKNSWLNHDNIVTCSRDGSAIIWIPKSRRSHGKSGRWTRAYHLRVPPPPMPPQPQRGGPRQRILPTPRGVNMIVWSLDNRFVLAAIMDCRICVWNASDGSLVHSLTGHTESTYVLDVHPFNPRIAMSAGYDGRTIVWDIWEGMPIRTYEISRFKLVDGKFSSDGTSIILSDDVGQLYILSTGQGESQKDAKYDQFFLGDYRPLIQDTHGNVLDQETQIVPYRRNLQDLLCDSAMIPYPEPYQSEFQQRRLGALGLEWRPSSLRLAVGPDFSLDPDYHMLPLADLDLLTEPLPEFIDAMEWEPEVEVFSDDTDSEYNVTEGFFSKGEKGGSSSNASGDSGCSTDNSEGEDTCMDSIRRSKRKKQKAETEVMTSSGRRVKRRNLDERDGNTFGSSRSRKGKSVQKTSRRKSSKSKSSRPQRAAARNALHLFSKITGTPTDGEEDSLVGDFSGSESTLQESNIDSDESGGTLQNEQLNYSKGKEVSYYESEDTKSHELTETHVNSMNKRLVLKLPNRDISKSTNEFGYQAELVGSSSKTAQEATDFNGNRPSSKDSGYCSGSTSYPAVEKTDQAKLGQVTDHVDLLGKIRWGMVRARSSKPLRVGEAMPSDTDPYSGKCPNHLDEKENVSSGHEKEDKNFSALTPEVTPELEIHKDDYRVDSLTEINGKKENAISGHEKEDKNFSALTPELTPELEIQKDDYKVDSLTEINENCAGTTSQPFNLTEDGGEITASSNCRDKNESLISAYVIPQDIVTASIGYSEVDQLPEPNIGFACVSTKLRSKRGSRDPESPSKLETKSSVLKNSACSTNDNKNLNNVVVDDSNNTRVASNHGENGSQEVDPQIRQNSTSQDLPEPHSHRDKMYKAVYRRSRSHRAVTNLADSSGQGESNSNGRNSNFNAAANFSNGTYEAIHTNGSLELEPTSSDPNYERNNLKVLQGPGNCIVKSPQNVSTSGGQLTEEERCSNSKLTVGLRSTRNRRSSYNIRETSPVNKRKSLQSATRGSWLLLSTHEEGCRYIPQQGDEVVYLRQGHQEYINYCRKRESGPWVSLKGHIRAVEYCRVQSLEYSHLPGSGDSCCKMNLLFVDPNSSVVGKSFKLTLPEVTSFPDFLVERIRFDTAMQRNWTRRDKCRVWWKNEDNSSGNWWDGRILCVKAKSSEFPDSPWESCTVRYKSDLTETHLHSPWELFDADTEWEQPHIDDDMRNKLQSALTKLQQSGNTVQDRYGVHELKKISNKSKFINRFPVPISIELIQSRLENNYYRSLEALKHDVTILLSNATTFLEKDAVLSAKIKRLSEWFTRTLSSL
ncbi:hypothetical protein AAZX31_09G036600 [Glycine max]|uniref:Bromo domain-containing protein n=1 Tax=Glycine max TaxID=3847 RepID=K7LBN8_SOYBN|nr:PH-interacting protein isoform X1 [Glycine max]XP_040861283.1 PH-interacting protein isoform X1 [Glycine max]XP_040861284.1 PH-interacting protein isoform X1 [Glycine max]KAH1041349.1 hypothetical protein GYH30_023943 [Glycine max]KRH36993.1 hypothetical protein GLYMA_09G037300v4 [Glycine max]|eukprot:XP_006586898.1 PH-interacting protein isoform X2 [Glycine max]